MTKLAEIAQKIGPKTQGHFGSRLIYSAQTTLNLNALLLPPTANTWRMHWVFLWLT